MNWARTFFLVAAIGGYSTVYADHPHDGPRTLIRGRMAPRRLRPADLFYRMAKMSFASLNAIDILLPAYPPSLWFLDHAQMWRVFVSIITPCWLSSARQTSRGGISSYRLYSQIVGTLSPKFKKLLSARRQTIGIY